MNRLLEKGKAMRPLTRRSSPSGRSPRRFVVMAAIAALAVSVSSANSSAIAAPARTASKAAKTGNGNPTVYPDIVPGDGGTAPDIFITTVSNTSTGILKFEIVLLNRTVLLGPDDIISIFIDADRNASTGDQNGMDYVLQVRGFSLVLARLFGSGRFEVVNAPSLVSVWVSPKQSISVAASDIGNPSSFRFFVHTFVVGNPDVFDDSPDGDGLWGYTLRTPQIASLRTSFAPAGPRAAKRFRIASVSAHLESDEDVQPDSISCRATLAGKVLRGSGAGGCSFMLPRTAKGKALNVKVTARFRDQTKTIGYQLPVH